MIFLGNYGQPDLQWVVIFLELRPETAVILCYFDAQAIDVVTRLFYPMNKKKMIMLS